MVAQRVEEVFARNGLIWELRLGGQTIRSTAEHPFYRDGDGWVPLHRLRVGDRLKLEDGSWSTIEGVRDTGRYEAVYNFRVREFHTYFVGDETTWGWAVWAHNIACTPDMVNSALHEVLPNKTFQGYGGLRQRVVEAIQGNHFDEASTLLQRMNGIGEVRAIRIVNSLIDRASNGSRPMFKVDWEVLLATRYGGAANVTHIPPGGGRLRYYDVDSWVSPSGLRYVGLDHATPPRNRIEHVLAHTYDNPARKVPHGVFDGGRQGALSIVDEAWAVAQSGSQPGIIRNLQGNGRIQYQIPMGRQIGYQGGNPAHPQHMQPAYRLELIIENGNHVMSAYPIV